MNPFLSWILGPVALLLEQILNIVNSISQGIGSLIGQFVGLIQTVQQQSQLLNSLQKGISNIMSLLTDLQAAVQVLKNDQGELATAVADASSKLDAIAAALQNLIDNPPSGGVSEADLTPILSDVSNLGGAFHDLGVTLEQKSQMPIPGATPPPPSV